MRQGCQIWCQVVLNTPVVRRLHQDLNIGPPTLSFERAGTLTVWPTGYYSIRLKTSVDHKSYKNRDLSLPIITFGIGCDIHAGVTTHRVDTDLVLLADIDTPDRTLVCIHTALPVISQVVAILSTCALEATDGVSTRVSASTITLCALIFICKFRQIEV